MSFFRFLRRRQPEPAKPQPNLSTRPIEDIFEDQPRSNTSKTKLDIRRYFHNERHFQCYTSWFAHWAGWISAGHCLTEAHDHLPDFAAGQEFTSWPDGLDAALVGCRLPMTRPADPVIGRDVIIYGFPAGSNHLAQRTARVYFERSPGQWIAQIFEPDEPVVTGMSGGPVVDAETGLPIGITITRNSPADLNNDRDPDESADFIALSSVWEAMKGSAFA